MLKINYEKCLGCGACINQCPKQALTARPDYKPKVNPKKCSECGECVQICPMEALKIIKNAGRKE